MTHPYFVAKAAAVFLDAGLDPAASAQLAAWAEEHRTAEGVHGVIVAVDGEIMAETFSAHPDPGVYVDKAGVERWQLGANVVDLATAAIKRQSGKDVMHVRRQAVCRGAAKFIRGDALAHALWSAR